MPCRSRAHSSRPSPRSARHSESLEPRALFNAAPAPVGADQGFNLPPTHSIDGNPQGFGAVVSPVARVEQVFLNAPGLTNDSFGDPDLEVGQVDAGIDPLYGYMVPYGADQLKPFPWITGVRAVALRFSADVGASIDQNDLQIRGINTPVYTPSAFDYAAVTKTAVWVLPATVFNDKIRLILDDAGVAGLDGDWQNGVHPYPSGDGSVGGDFDFRLNILSGDANRDGVVNALDLSLIKRLQGRSGATSPGQGAAQYSPFADITADGVINALDLAAARQRRNSSLPTGEPGATGLLTLESSPLVVVRDSTEVPANGFASFSGLRVL